MNAMLKLACVAVGLMVATPAAYAQACPALDLGGRAAPLTPAPRPIPLPDEAVPATQKDAVAAAVDWVGHYESGGADPWTSVSGQEQLSVGFMQWNWRIGTLVSVFMPEVPPEVIDAAAPEIRPGVRILKQYAADHDSAAARLAAQNVIEDWSTARPGDPLLPSRLRRSVVLGWQRWLDSRPLRSVQAALIEKNVKAAYSYALAWKRDMAAGSTPTPVDARTMAFFFDMQTFNGGSKPVWVDQVKAFRNRYPTRAAVIEQASAWLARCEQFVSPRPAANRKMYGRLDATATATQWRKTVSEADRKFEDDQIDLLVQALLRAQKSVGRDPPRGFPGVYQAEVLTRGGTIALGLGTVHKRTISTFP